MARPRDRSASMRGTRGRVGIAWRLRKCASDGRGHGARPPSAMPRRVSMACSGERDVEPQHQHERDERERAGHEPGGLAPLAVARRSVRRRPTRVRASSPRARRRSPQSIITSAIAIQSRACMNRAHEDRVLADEQPERRRAATPRTGRRPAARPKRACAPACPSCQRPATSAPSENQVADHEEQRALQQTVVEHVQHGAVRAGAADAEAEHEECPCARRSSTRAAA